VTWAITAGDARTVLAGWPAGAVQTICTSPPYWSQRAYGTPPQIWGGDPACAHIWQATSTPAPARYTGGGPNAKVVNTRRVVKLQQTLDGARCTQCNAWQGELGSEAAVDEYVAHLVELFRPARRALHPSGTLFLNIGDAYSNAGRAGSRGTRQGMAEGGKPRWTAPGTLGDKQLIGVPWRVAFGLQDDGWVLRQAIPWVKDNAKPETVTDRPNTSIEYVFLFSRSQRYYFNMGAVQQYLAIDRHWRNGDFLKDDALVFDISTQPSGVPHFAVMPERLAEACILAGSRPGDVVADPFTGAGTVGVVALRHGRGFWGAELNPAYVKMASERIVGDAPLFNRPAAEGAA
jgi:DNA modification methylase